MLHTRPRLAAGLHTALHAFAWCMVLLWLAALFRLAVSDRINDKATEENANILYHYGDLYGGDKEKMSLFVGGAKTIVNTIGESAGTSASRSVGTASAYMHIDAWCTAMRPQYRRVDHACYHVPAREKSRAA
jgi:hypothetical protein